MDVQAVAKTILEALDEAGYVIARKAARVNLDVPHEVD